MPDAFKASDAIIANIFAMSTKIQEPYARNERWKL